MDRRRIDSRLGPRRGLPPVLLSLLALVILIVSCVPHRFGGDQAAAERSTATGQPSPPGAATAETTPDPASPAATPTRTRVVYLDPGHGGPDTGTGGTTLDGTWVQEKDVTLAIALRTAERLRAAGIEVVLSRTSDELPGLEPQDVLPDGEGLTAEGVLRDLQRRIDHANASGANLLLSIHLNGHVDPAATGTETYYDSTRPFSDESRRLAELIQRHVVEGLREAGYDAVDRGVFDQTELEAPGLGVLPDYPHLVMLGPAVPGRLRPSAMPGVLNEVLFLSNPTEASLAQQPEIQDRIAQAYTDAILEFLAAVKS